MTIKNAEHLARELIAKYLGAICCSKMYGQYEKTVGEGAEEILCKEIRKLAPKLKINPEDIFFGYSNGINNYEIVKKIPRGFFVWNIGDCIGRKDLIPLCESKLGGEKYEIEPATLKVIKLPACEAELIRKAAGFGVNSLEAARKYAAGEYNAECSEIRLSTLAASVIAIYERITEI